MKNKIQQHLLVIACFLFGLLLLSLVLSLMLGAVNVSLTEVKAAFQQFDPENQQQQIIRSIRLPRVLGAAMVGASLAVSGALAQGITQNPLADSGLLGINAGAGLGLVMVFAFFPSAGYWWSLLFSFFGAGCSVGIIYYISNHSIRGTTPLRLTLVGAGISALFLSISQFIALYFNLNQEITFWTIGGVSAISWAQLRWVFPIFLLALGIAVIYSSSVTILRFGDDAAISLGKSPQQIRWVVSLVILILSGLSVALVGAISFVGLIVPHAMRVFTGENYRKLIPFSAIGGALLVVWADLLARMIHPPFETPFGLVTAVIGIPFFLYLFRKGGNLG